MVNREALDKIKSEYQGSEEERADILKAYREYKGDMDKVYEETMCSNVLDDDERFRKIVDDALAAKEVPSYRKYTQESESKKLRRGNKAKKEEKEAVELADELGVKEKLFGADAKAKKGKEGRSDEASLAALIQQRQKSREENFFDHLEAKYAGGKKPKKRAMDEPAEEAFQRNAARGKKKQKGSNA